MPRHDHPIFTAVYRVIARAEEAGPVGKVRTEVAAGVVGRLLIVGLGPGQDLHHLPPDVTEVVAIEPSASMRKAAAGNVARARDGGLPVEVIDAVAEDIPLATSSVDSALLSYVLCTVDDPERAVAEVARVVRPGGPVGVLEHTAAPTGTLMARMQTVVAPVWPRFAGGCRCNRDTRSELDRAGFDTSQVDNFLVAAVPVVGAGIAGVAVNGS
jgi:ubiquinone/menaquinone biosynthesis C-methylase UbiE